METSLLVTKLNIPPLRLPLVARPRLTRLLDEGLNYNLVLVSAPAGFGKTTLLSEWAQRARPRGSVAWLSLVEGDNDPARFWEYFIAALRTVRPAVGETALALLHMPQSLSIEPVIASLVNDLAAAPHDLFLVLDDYHFIQSTPIHSGVAFLLRHLPSRMHLVIATRVDPLLPLSQFRGKGTMLEIDADSLRFTLQETAALFKKMPELQLSAGDIDTLNSRTEGWVVGLKMAALALPRQKDVHRFITTFAGSQRYIMDYLMEEVLRQQSVEVQDFLLKTSVLERLTPALCDAVMGRQNSRDLLLKIENDHLFIVPLDGTGDWYRYEHLFAELLRHRLDTEFDKDKIAGLHRAASLWYEKQNFLEDAIHHALAARDWSSVMRLLGTISSKKERRGEWLTILGWMRALPEEALLSNPYIYWRYGKYLAVSSQTDAAEVALDKLEPFARQDIRLQGKIAAIRLMIAYTRRDLEKALELARIALSFLPEEDIEDRGFVCNIAGMVQLFNGAFSEAESLLKEAIEISRQTSNYFGISHSSTWLSTIYYYKGNLREASELCRKAIDSVPPSPAISLPLNYLGHFFYEWNDLEAALSHLEKANELNRFATNWEIQEWIYNELASTRFAMGDEHKALETLEKIDRMIIDTGLTSSLFRPQTVSFHIKMALRQGDLEAAREWGKKLSQSPTDLPFALVAGMHLLLALGEKAKAAVWLQEIYKGLSSDMSLFLMKTRLLQAEAAGTVEAGVAFLTEALTKGKAMGLVRTFVDEGMVLAPLLRQAISRGIEPGYSRKLLAIIEEEEERGTLRKNIPASDILSGRELEVLKLLAGGLSNQEIAARLVISLSTAKSHIHNIIAKLGAGNRTQAIARARETKLI